MRIKTFFTVDEVSCLGQAFSACCDHKIFVADLAQGKADLVGEEFAIFGVMGVCDLKVVFDIVRIHTDVVITLLVDANVVVLASVTSNGLRNHVIGRFHLGEVEVRNYLKLVCNAARREDVLALLIKIKGEVFLAVLTDWGRT